MTPDTPPAAIQEIVERTVAEHRARAGGLTFTVQVSGQPASYTSPTRPEFGWLLRLLEQQADAEPVALPILGGTLPLHVFTDVLGMPCLWIPAANRRGPAGPLPPRISACGGRRSRPTT